MSAPRRRLAIAALAAAVLALGILLLITSRPRADRGPDQRALAPAPAPAPALPEIGQGQGQGQGQGEPVAEPALVMAGGQPFWQPGRPHWYGPREDAFIRQPHDYPPGTPDVLGNRISQHLFDLERVGDMVRRGAEPDSEIAMIRGRPLEPGELEAARGVIQGFFDATVPDVDDALAGALSRDAAYDRIGPRRWRMNGALRDALGVTEEQFAQLWPHIADLAVNVHRLQD